jgi:hypothetical protein
VKQHRFSVAQKAQKGGKRKKVKREAASKAGASKKVESGTGVLALGALVKPCLVALVPLEALLNAPLHGHVLGPQPCLQPASVLQYLSQRERTSE